MEMTSAFRGSETHLIPQRHGARIRASSEGHGWSCLYASVQHENPFETRFHALSAGLLVVQRGASVPTTFTAQGRSVSRDLPRNSIFFLPPGHSCDLALQGHAQTLHIYLRPQLLHHRGDKPMTPMLVEADAILLHLAEAIERALCERMPNSAPFVEPVAEALAHRICIMSARAERGEVRAAGFADPELARLRQFIDAHLEDDIRVEVLARLFGLGVRSFVRSFKESTGTSPYQYVIAERIKRAKSLLAEGRTSLCDVALQCGFSHQEHLTRVFRKLTGQTPGQYRRQMTG